MNSQEAALKKIAIILLVIVGAGVLLYANYYLMNEILFGPSGEVKIAMKSDAQVSVSTMEGKDWLVFTPAQQAPKAGLVLYPEGYQDIRMYAPILRRIAQEGYQVIVLSRREKVPPTLEEEEQRVGRVMAAFPGVTTWFIGGHTWEASLAAAYATRHPDKVAGIVLWGGRLDAESSLANSKLPVLMIYGTEDDRNENLVSGIKPYLPPQTVWVVIEGGNRVNFANFGPMPRDVAATIPIQEQQAQAAAATLDFFQQLVK